MPAFPDMDSRLQIEAFVDRFYQRVLADAELAPIFLEVAAVDLVVHLPHIKDYWCKLLLGETAYRRHTMNIHRQLHEKRPLRAVDFNRWLHLFQDTVDSGWTGHRAERAKRVAKSIAENMQVGLKSEEIK